MNRIRTFCMGLGLGVMIAAGAAFGLGALTNQLRWGGKKDPDAKYVVK